MATNPPAPDPVSDIDGPGVYPTFEPVEHIAAEHFPETDSEHDYNEQLEDPDSGQLPETNRTTMNRKKIRTMNHWPMRKASLECRWQRTLRVMMSYSANVTWMQKLV